MQVCEKEILYYFYYFCNDSLLTCQSDQIRITKSEMKSPVWKFAQKAGNELLQTSSII